MPRSAISSARGKHPWLHLSGDALHALPWQRYRTTRGDSGVRAFALAADAIAVVFVNGSIYLYTDASAGRACITRMRDAALAGRGLSTLISRTVKARFAARLS